MPRWQAICREILQIECVVSIVLMLLAALLIASAMRMLTSDTAQLGKIALANRLERVTDQARRDGCTYTVKFIPDSSEMHIIRWITRRSTEGSVENSSILFTHRLPSGVLIERTTMPFDELVISESGLILSSGDILLRAYDGSRATLAIGEQKIRRRPVRVAAE